MRAVKNHGSGPGRDRGFGIDTLEIARLVGEFPATVEGDQDRTMRVRTSRSRNGRSQGIGGWQEDIASG